VSASRRLWPAPTAQYSRLSWSDSDTCRTDLCSGVRVRSCWMIGAAPIRGADPNDHIVHEYDLRDVVNLLWMAGLKPLLSTTNGWQAIIELCLGSTSMVTIHAFRHPILSVRSAIQGPA